MSCGAVFFHVSGKKSRALFGTPAMCHHNSVKSIASGDDNLSSTNNEHVKEGKNHLGYDPI